MKKTFLERYSFIILICLVFTSLLQVGILWSYHNHGVPISFLKMVMGYEQEEKLNRGDFFRPYKINILNGYDEPDISLTLRYEDFGGYWEILKDNLVGIFNDGEIALVEDYSDEKWAGYLRKPGVLAKFHNEFHVDMLKYFLDLDEESQIQIESLEKILFSLDSRRRNVDVYIVNSQNIYSYRMAVNDEFKALFDESFLEGIDEKRFFGFSLLQEIFPQKEMAPFYFLPDVDVYVRGERFLPINNLQVSLPEWLGKEKQELKYVNKAANDILGEDRYSYHADIDEAGNVVLGNINHIYRISSDGFLEYKYLGDNINSQEVIVGEAFEKAIDFIIEKNSWNNLNHLYLSDAYYEDDKNLYTFVFDYAVDDLLVLFKSSDGTGYENFASITTDGYNVLDANMVVRKISIQNTVNYFDTSFRAFSANLFELEDMNIKELFVGYVHDLDSEGSINPYWLIKEGDNSFLSLSMGTRRDVYGLE